MGRPLHAVQRIPAAEMILPARVSWPLGQAVIGTRRFSADVHFERSLHPVSTIIAADGNGGVHDPVRWLCVL